MGKKRKHAAPSPGRKGEQGPVSGTSIGDLLGGEALSKLKAQAEELKRAEAEQEEQRRKEREEQTKREQKARENDFAYLLENSDPNGNKYKS